MPSPYAARWDKRTAEGAAVPSDDLGWIGEDGGGVWIACHPLSALLERPELWGIVGRFSGGVQEVTQRDFDELSAYEFDAHLVMVSAVNSRMRREAKPEGSEDR